MMTRINVRTKGQEGEREVARALNSIVESVLESSGYSPPGVPVVQRNQNQSAVGGSDLTNPFGLSIEVKRQEQLNVKRWWQQCVDSAVAEGNTPVLVYRGNKKSWSVILHTDIPIGENAHVCKVRSEITWDSFLEWFFYLVRRKINTGEWEPHS